MICLSSFFFLLIDALLSETVTNNPYILGDLANCLDIEYQYGKIPCWRDLAKLLAIPADIYKHCNSLSITSPTEDLFSFLSAIKPQLTIAEIKEALEEIGRLDVAQLLEMRIKGRYMYMLNNGKSFNQ